MRASDLAAIYVMPGHPSYDFIERLSAKGLLPRAGLGTKPWTRTQIAAALLEVDPADRRLTQNDVARWRFYAGEFADEIAALTPDGSGPDISPAWWTRAATESTPRPPWWRTMFSVYERDGASGQFDVGVGTYAKYDTAHTLARQIRAGGWVRLGSHWSAQAQMVDDAIVGPEVTPPPRYGPEPGTAYIDGDTASTFVFDDPRAYVSYHSRYGTASAGVFPVVMGHGKHGQLILSEKPPPVPHVRLTVHPWPWLSFTYLHMTLQSGIADTTSPMWAVTPGKTSYFQKYYAGHRLEIRAVPGIDIGIGESVIYGARSPALAYMVPVIPFRAAEHAEGDLDNLQMYADIAITLVPYTRLYGTFFIDELHLAKIFDDTDARNWWIWQAGMLATDIWGAVPDLDLRVEYVRANPWVYAHQYPWNTYDTWAVAWDEPVVAYPLGFWNGHNGDFIRTDLTWRPFWNAEATVWWSQTRRGSEGTREMLLWGPKRPFLFGDVMRERAFGMQAEWEPWRDVSVFGEVARHARQLRTEQARTDRNWTAFNLGMRYRVW